MKRAAFFCMAVCAWAQNGLDRPSIGLMLDRSGAARAVAGLPGSWSAGDAAATEVISVGCGSFCLIKTDASLIGPGATIAAPAGPALFAFDATGAFVYFEKARQLARWQAGALTMLDGVPAGDVIGLRSVNGAAQFAVRFAEQIRIEDATGAVIEALPNGLRAVVLLDSGEVWATADTITLHREDGTELSFPLAGATALFAMSADYMEIRTSAAVFALRVTAGREGLFELPEPGQ